MSTVTGTDSSIPHDRERSSIPKGQYATVAVKHSGFSSCAVASGGHSVSLPKNRLAPDPWQNYSSEGRGKYDERKKVRKDKGGKRERGWAIMCYVFSLLVCFCFCFCLFVLCDLFVPPMFFDSNLHIT